MKRKSITKIVKSKNTILNYFSTLKEENLEKCETLNDTSKFECKSDIDITDLINLSKFDNKNDIVTYTEITQSSPGYLVRNFSKLLTEVLNVKNDEKLFSKHELEIISNYQNLSNNSKNFVLRLLVRQWKWHRFDKQKIKDSKVDIENLISLEFITDQLNILSLAEKLELLLHEEIDILMKKFNMKSLKGKRKNDLIEIIIKTTNQKNEISQFFTSKSFKNSLLFKVETELNCFLNSTYKLTNNVRKTFSKLIVLISITCDTWEECSHLGERLQKELFFLLQLEKGEICLPTYKVSRKSNIFHDQSTLENYVIAIEHSLKLRNFLDNNRFDDANQIYEEFSNLFPIDNMLSSDMYQSDPSSFLSRFSVRSLLIHVQSCAVDMMEKRREYSRAVDLLKSLLIITKPTDMNETRISKARAKWYLRIVIDYSHMHNNKESCNWLEKALEDETVPESSRITFRARHLKISKNKSIQFTPEIDLVDERALVFQWRKLQAPWQRDMVTGTRPRYMWRETNGVTNHCFVEDFVILHEIANGSFMYGLHGETSTFILLFELFFHDIIYADVTDAFYNARQWVPLDLFSKHFRENRAKLFEQRFDWLRNRATIADINAMLRDNWRLHSGELGIVTSWQLFDSEIGPIELVSCLGVKLVMDICEKFVENFQFWKSGMPDLVLWDSKTQHYEIVEVKGPGDKLSDKQMLWIVELQRMGARVTVCQVEGVSYKAL